MHKLLISVSLITSSLIATDNFNLHTGWNNIGSSNKIDITKTFNNPNIKVVWKYDNTTKKWLAYSPDETLQNKIQTLGFSKLDITKENEAFWILTAKDINVNNEINTTSLLAGKSFYLVHKYVGDPDLEKYGWVMDYNVSFNDDASSIFIHQLDDSPDSEDVSDTTQPTTSLKIINVFNDVIETFDTEDNQTRYLVSNETDAKNLATLLNVKETKKYNNLYGKTIYGTGLADNQLEYILYGWATYSSDDKLVGYDAEENHSFNVNYELLEDDTISKTEWESDDVEYCKIVDVDLKKAYIIESCDNNLSNLGTDETIGYIFLNKDKALSFIEKENSDIPPKIQINPTSLRGNMLYHISGIVDDNRIFINGFKLNTDDNNLTKYHSNSWSFNTDMQEESNGDCNYSYNVSYNDDKTIDINGYFKCGDYDYAKENFSSKVYQYNLGGYTLPLNVIATNDGEKVIKNNYPTKDLKHILFTKGKLYCTLLWTNCWMDEDAVKEVINYLK